VLALALKTSESAFIGLTWRDILRAAYPRSGLRFKTAWAASQGGTAINALTPAQAGTAAMIGLFRSSIPGSALASLEAEDRGAVAQGEAGRRDLQRMAPLRARGGAAVRRLLLLPDRRQRRLHGLKGVKTMFHSGCGSVVLMHEAAEAVAAADVTGGRLVDVCGFGRLKRESAVGAVAVVVLDVGPQDVFEMAAADDQQPVEALVADGADESLGVGVRLRRLHRRADNRGCAWRGRNAGQLTALRRGARSTPRPRRADAEPCSVRCGSQA
jgi:hypothetical protein